MGSKYYDAGQFEQASKAFEKAIDETPGISEYHHMLGKSYGRIAQQANWFKAMYLARKTLHEFQTAVELDQLNKQAAEDLAEYYLLAPEFLGGSKKKARQIQETLLRSQGENDREKPESIDTETSR